jgi:hypothetical protein
MSATVSASAGHTPTPASRVWISVAFLASTVVTSLAGYYSASLQADKAAVRTEQIAEIGRFLKSTEQFEPLMRAHMLNLVHHRDITASREALVENIQQQHVVLDTVSAYLPADVKSDAKQYEDVLVATADALSDAKTPLLAGRLMQQANNAVVTKRKLAADLRRGAGLPS